MVGGVHATKSPIQIKRRDISSFNMDPVKETPPDGRHIRIQLKRLPSTAAKPWPKLPPASNMLNIVGISATLIHIASVRSGLDVLEEMNSANDPITIAASTDDKCTNRPQYTTKRH